MPDRHKGVPVMRRCPGRRCPHLVPDDARYCPEHAATYEAHRGSSTQRGYGTAHQRLRTQWEVRIRGGEEPPCTLCGEPILPEQAWHLDHTEDRTAYRGPAHAHCNTSDGGTRGASAGPQRRAGQ